MNLHDMLCLIAVCPNWLWFYLQYSYNVLTGVLEGAAGEIWEIIYSVKMVSVLILKTLK
jgi:hypothetical protein